MKDRVFAHTAKCLSSAALAPRQGELLLHALASLQIQLEDEELLFFIDVPRFTFQTLDDRDPPLDLLAATTIFFLGIDLLDDLADGDLPAAWSEFDEKEIQLAAVACVSSLPQRLLLGLPLSAERRCALVQEVADALLVMSAGQGDDIRMANQLVVDPDAVEASVVQKTGAEIGLFASLGAIAAGASSADVEQYRSFGAALGTAGQLASDCHDLFQAPTSKDLANGTRTYPIAYALHKMAGTERSSFVQLLARAKTDTDLREEMRCALIGSGALRMTAFLVELYCERARGLAQGERLLELIDSVSFFRNQQPTGGGNHGEERDRSADRQVDEGWRIPNTSAQGS